jgi:hypothetical protein
LFDSFGGLVQILAAIFQKIAALKTVQHGKYLWKRTIEDE